MLETSLHDKENLLNDSLARQAKTEENLKSSNIFKLFNAFKSKTEEENAILVKNKQELEEKLENCLKNIEVLTNLVNQSKPTINEE